MESEHPASVYARRHWLGERSRSFRAHVNEQIDARMGLQKRDGSFGSIAATIEHLFSLYLLGAKTGPEIQKALDFLLERGKAVLMRSIKTPPGRRNLFLFVPRKEKALLAKLTEIPLCPGDSGLLKTSAAILNAGLFGEYRRPEIRRALAGVEAMLGSPGGPTFSLSNQVNLLISCTSHKNPTAHRLARLLVYNLSEAQEANGRWKQPARLLPTAWGLSRVKSRQAKKTLIKAIPALLRAQNKDGSWGRKQVELQSWMATAVLKKAGVIP